ncbi:MAG: hypothetical protein IKM23_05650 [Bacteroidales bacterium]|nr:hypothetical protein [Bacteroidales bacterium]
MEIVTFELAKKLKKKGYPQKSSGDVTMHGTFYYGDGRLYENGGICEVKDAYTADTIYEVMKWMREEKKMHLIVEIADSGWYYTLYPNVRWENDKLKSDTYIMSFKNKASYEKAALAGIEYVLDNLI